jgi:phospholipid-binding lipoprotein MlaA
VARLVAATVLLATGACATPPSDPDAKAAFEEANDPAEPTNRSIFDANQFLDRNIIKPTAQAYEDNIPESIRVAIHNFLSNLRQPFIGFNDVLQGNLDRAWTTTRRFVVNTTVGGLGFFDVATDWDLPGHQADFGQTLGVWGVDEGPFVELPVFGPSNPRDAVGLVVGLLADPFNYVGGGVALTAAQTARGATEGVQERAENMSMLDSVEKTSLDYYAELRSLYRQHRDAMIEEGKSREGRRGTIEVKFPNEEEM